MHLGTRGLSNPKRLFSSHLVSSRHQPETPEPPEARLFSFCFCRSPSVPAKGGKGRTFNVAVPLACGTATHVRGPVEHASHVLQDRMQRRRITARVLEIVRIAWAAAGQWLPAWRYQAAPAPRDTPRRAAAISALSASPGLARAEAPHFRPLHAPRLSAPRHVLAPAISCAGHAATGVARRPSAARDTRRRSGIEALDANAAAPHHQVALSPQAPRGSHSPERQQGASRKPQRLGPKARAARVTEGLRRCERETLARGAAPRRGVLGGVGGSAALVSRWIACAVEFGGRHELPGPVLPGGEHHARLGARRPGRARPGAQAERVGRALRPRAALRVLAEAARHAGRRVPGPGCDERAQAAQRAARHVLRAARALQQRGRHGLLRRRGGPAGGHGAHEVLHGQPAPSPRRGQAGAAAGGHQPAL
eukprot:scaffold596_cov236-Pinguiococcus_pyrenoidosus.AAC.30